MAQQPEPTPPLTPADKLAAVANAGGDIAAAAFEYAAALTTGYVADEEDA